MNIWTKDNIINYTSDPDEVNDKKYPKELQVARKALRKEWCNSNNIKKNKINVIKQI